MSETPVEQWWAGLTAEEQQDYGELVEHGRQTRDWGPAYAYVVGRLGDGTQEPVASFQEATERRHRELAQTTP